MTQGLSFQMPASAPDRQVCEAAIAQLLAQAQCDLQLAKEMAQAFEMAPIVLGDLVSQSASDSASPSAKTSQGHLLLVLQGRVRLLCESDGRHALSRDTVSPAASSASTSGSGIRREFSAQVIEAGATLGELKQWDTDQPYRAVAASSGWVARISWAQLKPWLKQMPSLHGLLRETARQRDALIFLRTQVFGDDRSVASYQIQLLQEQLTTIDVAKGTAIATATPILEGGYAWLRRGKIKGKNAPLIGQGWGQPETTPPDWIAETTVRCYALASDRCSEACNLGFIQLPFCDVADTEKAGPGLGRPKPANRVSPLRGLLNHESAPSKAAQQQDPQAPSNKKSEPGQHGAGKLPDVAFPKPPRQLRLRLWNRFPFIAQQSMADCGPTCLAMVGLYWGHRFNVNVLRDLAHVGRSGATLKNLAGAAEKVGFAARPVRASLNRLTEQNMPWIAHWQGDHYVVIYKAQGDRLLLSDPDRGKRLISKQNFLRNWTGYALLLEPTARLKQSEATQKASLSRFWKILWPYRNTLWQIIFLSLLMQVFGLVSPILTQVILDQVVVQKSIDTLNVFIIGALLFGIWEIGLGAVRQYLLDFFSNRLNLTLVSGFINHTLRLPMSFFETRQVGDIITRVRENQKIQAFLMRQAVSTWLDATMAVVYLGLMFYYNAQLAWLVVALLPPIVLLTLAATPFLKQLSREVFNKAAEQNSLLVEMLTGVSTVKASAAEQEIRWRWEERLTELLNIQFRTQKLTNGLQVMSGLINSAGSLALLWFGAKLVIDNQLTIGQLVAFNMLIGNVIGPVLSLVGLWDEFQEVLIAVERLNDVLETKPEDQTGKPMLVMPPIQGEVRFENVTFRYEQAEDQNILQNISFAAHPGESIALVGRSGSGKTTLIKLLQGMYQPTSGRISIDGHDISHVSPSSLRSQMGVVPQESFLFSGNILENVKIYRDNYSLEEVVEVSKLAEAHAFIQELPMGYSTKVGERGANLSGGQRQRVAIARALLGDPAILLLDEATSALDTESERRFQQNLTHISRGRTTFIIAHRLSTVRNADRILVLDRGVIVEQGNHEALVAQKGLYYHLAQQQLEL